MRRMLGDRAKDLIIFLYFFDAAEGAKKKARSGGGNTEEPEGNTEGTEVGKLIDSAQRMIAAIFVKEGRNVDGGGRGRRLEGGRGSLFKLEVDKLNKLGDVGNQRHGNQN